MRPSALPLEAQPDHTVHLCGLLGLELKARFEASGDEELFPHRLRLDGPDASWLMANRGAGLDALQYLLHEAQGGRDEAQLVHLDVQQMRMFRLHELKAMATLAMDKARSLGVYSLSGLNSRERRWVHLIVAREADLQSESEGMGSVKTLKILRKS